MLRLFCLTLLSLNLVSATFVAADDDLENKPKSEAYETGVRRAARDQERRALNSLNQRITIEAVDLPLKDVLTDITHLTQREILIDIGALADDGISPDQNVSLNIGELTVLQAFHFLLKPLDLTWVANDGIIEITTSNRASQRLVTRVYDVRNLCKWLDPLTRDLASPRPEGHRRRDVSRGTHTGGMGGGGLFSLPANSTLSSIIGQVSDAAPAAAEQGAISIIGSVSVEELLSNLISNLRTLKWLDQDGEGGTVQAGRGCLIVSQTYEGQLEIAGLLQALESMVDGSVRGKSISAHRLGYPHAEDAAIFEALARQTNFEVTDEELKTVIERTQHEVGIRVLFDNLALADEGISSDQNVNLQISKLPLGICLKKLLDPFQLCYVVEEGVLVITTKARAENTMSFRFYDISGCGKVVGNDPDTGLVPMLMRATSGKWLHADGAGDFAGLISTRHLAVFQSQRVHAEIDLLIDELTSDSPDPPVEPPLKLKVYSTPDVDTANDLKQILPRLVAHWSDNGTINQAGTSLLVNQPASVHHQIHEIIAAVNESRGGSAELSHPASISSETRAAKP